MLRAFTEGFLQLKDPRVFRLVIRAATLTLVIYAALFASLLWILRNTQISEVGWIEALADWGAGFAAGIIATFLFPGLVTAILSAFLDTVATAVEELHYPARGPARAIPVGEAIGSALRLAAWSIGINLLCLPLYLFLLLFPPLNLIVFAAINGRLIGRDYFETVALRHLSPAAVKELRSRHGGTLWLAGSITAGLLTIPLLNLVMPVVGGAAMVHLFHKLTVRT
ncbi:MAG: hypothetical protein FJX59_03410 [Alphaproteobacteria bacterium]|nr:hypothetical protein [Alphaproteobacteria bacterium]